jgi:hypothetical protein
MAITQSCEDATTTAIELLRVEATGQGIGARARDAWTSLSSRLSQAATSLPPPPLAASAAAAATPEQRTEARFGALRTPALDSVNVNTAANQNPLLRWGQVLAPPQPPTAGPWHPLTTWRQGRGRGLGLGKRGHL